MKVKVKLKSHDALINVRYLKKEDREILNEHGFGDRTHVSYRTDLSPQRSQFVEELKHGKQAFTYEELMNALESQPEKEFMYLASIRSIKKLNAEVNIDINDASKFTSNLRLGLGLREFTYHHIAKDDKQKDNEKIIVSFSTYSEDVFFYPTGVDGLINDIRRIINEWNSKD